MDSGQRERNPWRPKAAGGGRTRSLLLHDKCCPVQVKLQWGCESLILSLHLHFVVLTSQASWGQSWGALIRCALLCSLTHCISATCLSSDLDFMFA